MPKKIENIREMLLVETRRQIEENGYSAMTIRSVAAACGLGTGTVYNYFKSKDAMIASFMLDDWNECLDSMRLNGGAVSPDAGLCSIYQTLQHFMEEHSALFGDEGAEKSFATGFFKWHKVLRGQLAEIIKSVCTNTTNQDFLPEFIAESMLAWCGEGIEYKELAPIFTTLISQPAKCKK